ncbi:MAG TPA: histidine phosphatase family protein [Candidatus Binatia bacterium]|nr:histidine phosphatase family protein [Candidatus Binatia bacterium]
MASSVLLYLIRHGRPSAGFAEAQDPGLDEVGQMQAEAVAQELASLGPLSILTSPLKRARETAVPLEAVWRVQARVEQAVAEIPTPTVDPQMRSAWLHQALRGRWSELPTTYRKWREQVAAVLSALRTPTVITTHFVAINVAVGVATGDDRMVCFEPDHCSCTVLEVIDRTLRVVTLGRQRATQIR